VRGGGFKDFASLGLVLPRSVGVEHIVLAAFQNTTAAIWWSVANAIVSLMSVMRQKRPWRPSGPFGFSGCSARTARKFVYTVLPRSVRRNESSDAFRQNGFQTAFTECSLHIFLQIFEINVVCEKAHFLMVSQKIKNRLFFRQ